MNELTRRCLVDRFANIISDYEERDLSETDIEDLNHGDLICIMECLQYGQKSVIKNNEWIPFLMKYDDDEERDILQCPFPADEHEILVTDGFTVWGDTFFRDIDGCFLDSGSTIFYEVLAWQPLPEPYEC